MRRLCSISLILLPILLAAGCHEPAPTDPGPGEAVVTGTLTHALTDVPDGGAGGAVDYSNLRVVVVTTGGSTRTVAVAQNGDFTLALTKGASYALNVLDANTKLFTGSFLFRAGALASVVLNVADDRIDLGRCQFLDTEVWCENGFFGSPTQTGRIETADDTFGTIRFKFNPDSPDAPVLQSLFGGTSADLAIVPNPANRFNVAVFNTTKSQCAQPLVGTVEKAGRERYLYTQNVYENATCRAVARYQATCTLAADNTTCNGFLRVDISSSGADCAAWPPLHVAEPVTATLLGGVPACAAPTACTADTQCPSRVCAIDTGFCQSATRPRAVRIHALDIGQGDSTLIVSPSGKTLLIDGGKQSAGRTVAALVRRLASRLDYIVVTHFDTDHMGGIAPIILGPDGAPGKKGVDDNMNGSTDEDAEVGAPGSDDLLPTLALDRGTTPTSTSMDAYLRAVGARRRQALPGETLDLGDPDLTVKILSSNGALFNGMNFTPTEENDRSVGVYVKFGDFSYLTMGDLPGDNARKLEQSIAGTLAAQEGPVDVLHAGHHGSAESSDADFLGQIKPKVAVISVGDSDTCGAGFNTYGLPAQPALDRLASAGVRAFYQTETGGPSFSGSCVLNPGQAPRTYNNIPRTVAYSTITVEAYKDAFRVMGVGFDDHFLAK